MDKIKRNVAMEATVRANLYEEVLTKLESLGYPSTPIKGGALVTIEDNLHVKLSISVVGEDKVEKYLTEYAEQQKKNAERIEARARKAEEKAAKARAKANQGEEA